LNDILALSREKWRELPAGGSARTFAADLMSLGDSELLDRWHAMVSNDRAWAHSLYQDTFAGRRIVEVGSGLGGDGVHFLKHGAYWTFSDLVPENLGLVRRIVTLLGLADRASYHVVDDARAFARLPGRVDVVWAIGSLHHVPLDIARIESLDLLSKLNPGGRWIELTYPYERWQREGAPTFQEFGKRTDGDRTPWAEWYDLEKVKVRLFPSKTTTILDFNTSDGNFGWIDLRIDEPAVHAQVCRERDLMGLPAEARNGARLVARPGEWQLTCPAHRWWYAMTIDLTAAVDDVGVHHGYACDLELHVDAGSVGVALTATDIDSFLGSEKVVDARTPRYRTTVSSTKPPRFLLLRNTADGIASKIRVVSAVLRPGA
jgi:hypothetical protein